MEIKRILGWFDLPKVEAPTMARVWVDANEDFNPDANGFGMDSLVGPGSVLAEEGPFASTQELASHRLNTLLQAIDDCEIFLVHGPGTEPMLPLVRFDQETDTYILNDYFTSQLARANAEHALQEALRNQGTLSPAPTLARPENSPVAQSPEPKEEQEPELTSTFAHDQLTRVANNSTKGEFVATLVPIFGTDIPAGSYVKLWEALREGTLESPEIELVSGGEKAAYDSYQRKIQVREEIPYRAARNEKRSWSLLTMLLHEYGHHIDTVLRKDFTEEEENVARDSEGEEGARYAYEIAALDVADTDETEYAHYKSERYTGPLTVEYSEVRQAIMDSQDGDVQSQEAYDGHLETFVANNGEHGDERPDESFGHGSIGRIGLKKAAERFEDEALLDKIYFGNWLRDYSQVVDPKIVRPEGAPKDLSKYISRESLTEIIDIKAIGRFLKDESERDIFRVDPVRLGVYRAVEHIDNPTNNDPNATDPQTIDLDFEPLPTKEYVEVDPNTSMKRYIMASVAFMKEEIEKAVALGPGPDGYRHFGSALHVLEDYFSHTNYVELSIRKLGRDFQVLAWTAAKGGKHELPVVTGRFDSEDIVASTAAVIGEMLFPADFEFTPVKPGERTESDRTMLVLLKEHSDTRYLERFRTYLKVRDWLAENKAYNKWKEFSHYTIGMVFAAYNFLFNRVFYHVGEAIDDYQTLAKGDPNEDPSLDPTHSQLAKDHDSHPFHVLAATLAIEAVRNVGEAMHRAWNGDRSADPAGLAAAYCVHPNDSSWQDPIVAEWARNNKDKVRQGKSRSQLERLAREHLHHIKEKYQTTKERMEQMLGGAKKNWEQILDMSPEDVKKLIQEYQDTLEEQLEAAKHRTEELLTQKWEETKENISRIDVEQSLDDYRKTIEEKIESTKKRAEEMLDSAPESAERAMDFLVNEWNATTELLSRTELERLLKEYDDEIQTVFKDAKSVADEMWGSARDMASRVDESLIEEYENAITERLDAAKKATEDMLKRKWEQTQKGLSRAEVEQRLDEYKRKVTEEIEATKKRAKEILESGADSAQRAKEYLEKRWEETKAKMADTDLEQLLNEYEEAAGEAFQGAKEKVVQKWDTAVEKLKRLKGYAIKYRDEIFSD